MVMEMRIMLINNLAGTEGDMAASDCRSFRAGQRSEYSSAHSVIL